MTIKPNDAIDGEDKAEGESKDKRSGAVRTGRLRGALSDLFICIELIGMGLLAMLAISLVLSAMWWLTRESGGSVQKETAAGQVLRVELKGGLFTRALVETDAGFYALQEGASLRKGELVTLRERRDGSRSLCDLEGRCTGLLGCCVELIKWIGSSNGVHPTLNFDVPTDATRFADAVMNIFPVNVARLHELARGARDGRGCLANHATHPIGPKNDILKNDGTFDGTSINRNTQIYGPCWLQGRI